MLIYSHFNSQSQRFIYQLNEVAFVEKIKAWASQFELVSYYDSHDYYKSNPSEYAYQKYDFLLAFSESYSTDILINNRSLLNNYIKKNKDWIFGYLSYDLKNEIHDLESKNKADFKFDDLFFYTPEIVVYKTKGSVFLESQTDLDLDAFISKVNNFKRISAEFEKKPEFIAKQSKEAYVERVNQLKNHIQVGDIYEVNFCQEFYSDKCNIEAWQTYQKLCKLSPTPFSAYFKQKDLHLLSASPERFLVKRGDKIVSQPIKGTIKMSQNSSENQELINNLKNDPKEQSENVMIVDLVRNDLSQTAKKGSVKVEELFGIYPFKQLYQMISTVSSIKKDEFSSLDVILSCFPMGSMTGAPKKRAMELIDQYETSRRSLFSGTVGYFDPDGDFDFNVIIRSLFYDSNKKYLAYTVGSAITIQSDAEKEYDECLLKAKAIRDIFA